jgi:aminodeoxyfutalosine deaminase
MRKISASYIFPVSAKPLKQGILVVSDDGEILDTIDTKGKLAESGSLEYYNGIIVPGFVNAHCHLELSYMKGLVDKANGLPDFLWKLSQNRRSRPENLSEIISSADQEMRDEGIVAVGDISNDDFSFETKRNSSVYYHTLIEVYWPDSNRATEVFSKADNLFKILDGWKMPSSIVPHTPYSVSPQLFEKVLQHANKFKRLFSIHNQETKSENELFYFHSGAMCELFKKIGATMEDIKITGKSSLQSVMSYFPNHQNILLVHNIYTEQNDIDIAKSSLKKLFWVLCPNSNIIIENRLPDIDLFVRNNLNLAIGTDSYSSNTKLSVLDELKTISSHYPLLSLELLLKWATINGANALEIDKKFGSFEKGKKPGINLITDIDFENMKLTKESKVKKLV